MSIASKIKTINEIIIHHKLLKDVIKSYLFCLRNSEQSVWGSITEDDEAGIRQAVALAAAFEGPIVEIGVLFGHTTNLIASIKSKEIPLIAVENFTWNPFLLSPDVHRQFTRRTIRYALEHCSTQIFDGAAAEFYSANQDLKPSLVFIDAFHDYDSVRRDIDWAVSVDCPIISGHDYVKNHPGVIRAVKESFGEDISLYGSVWVHQVRQV